MISRNGFSNFKFGNLTHGIGVCNKKIKNKPSPNFTVQFTLNLSYLSFPKVI